MKTSSATELFELSDHYFRLAIITDFGGDYREHCGLRDCHDLGADFAVMVASHQSATMEDAARHLDLSQVRSSQQLTLAVKSAWARAAEESAIAALVRRMKHP